MSIASEYDMIANKYRFDMAHMTVKVQIITRDDGLVRLNDITARQASVLSRCNWTNAEIGNLFGVPESAVTHGIQLYRKYEEELM